MSPAERAAKGLDADGFIAREGSLARVPPVFAPVVEAARTAITDAFGPGLTSGTGRLHSAYLYGSIPRGAAVPGVSDADLTVVLRDEPADGDRRVAAAIERALDDRFSQVNGVGILLTSVTTILSDLERHDLGWFVACLCTPLLGEDLASRLPRYRPTSLLARETNGDLGDVLPEWRARLADAGGASGLRRLSRYVSRRVIRTGFTLVMPWWGGWTSDLDVMASVFGQYYPARAEQMRTARAIARVPGTDVSALGTLIDDLGPWLAAEYLAVHGRKTPRPGPAALVGGGRVLAQDPDQADDVLGDEPPDGAARVHADDDLARRVEHEPGGLQVHRVGVDERPGGRGDGPRVGPVADREGQLVLGDQLGRGLLVIDRDGDDPDAVVRERLAGPLEGAQLRVAVRAPRAPVEEHDGEIAGERVRDGDRLAVGGVDGQPRK
jgi:uncharacterized protein